MSEEILEINKIMALWKEVQVLLPEAKLELIGVTMPLGEFHPKGEFSFREEPEPPTAQLRFGDAEITVVLTPFMVSFLSRFAENGGGLKNLFIDDDNAHA